MRTKDRAFNYMIGCRKQGSALFLSRSQNANMIFRTIKELGAKYVISKANRDIHAKFLLKNGADEVIYPDRDITSSRSSTIITSLPSRTMFWHK